MQGISGFSPIAPSFDPLPLVKGETERGLDARFLQSIIEVATGLSGSAQGGLSSVASAKEESQPDFFTNPEKVAGKPCQNKEKNIDEILGEIEKILSQIKEENR